MWAREGSKRAKLLPFLVLLLLVVPLEASLSSSSSSSSSFSSSSTTTRSNKDTTKRSNQDRSLEELTLSPTLPPRRGCGQELGVVTPADIRALARTLLSPFLLTSNDTTSSSSSSTEQVELLERSLDIVLKSVTYNSTIVNLCASCQTHADWYYERGGGLLNFPAHHATYCQDLVEEGNEFNTELLNTIALIPRILPEDVTSPALLASTPTYATTLPPQLHLRAFLTLPPTPIYNPYNVPSLSFPSSLIDFDADMAFITTHLPGLVAAGSGSVAIFPNYPGLGDGRPTTNSDGTPVDTTSQRRRSRSILDIKSYEQATAVSFLAVQRHLMDISNACTLLDMEAATVYGVDDGAFGAVAATQILQRFNVRSLSTFVSAGPLNLEELVRTAVNQTTEAETSSTSSSDGSTSTVVITNATTNSSGTATVGTTNVTTDAATVSSTATLNDWLRLAAYTFSYPTNRNATFTSLASPSWFEALSNVFGTLAPSTPESVSLLPPNSVDLLDPDLVTLYLQAADSNDTFVISSPCNYSINEQEEGDGDSAALVVVDSDNATDFGNINVDVVDDVCPTVVSASVYPLLLSQRDENWHWLYNISVCYSETDEVVDRRHYEHPALFDAETNERAAKLQAVWRRYTQPLGLDALQIVSGYNHATTLQLCAIAPILFFTLQGHVPEDPLDQANARVPFTEKELQSCSLTTNEDGTFSTTTPPSDGSSSGGDSTGDFGTTGDVGDTGGDEGGDETTPASDSAPTSSDSGTPSAPSSGSTAANGEPVAADPTAPTAEAPTGATASAASVGRRGPVSFSMMQWAVAPTQLLLLVMGLMAVY